MIDWKAISAEIEAMTTDAIRLSTPGGSDKVAAEHIQDIVWHEDTAERHELLSPAARRNIENRVAAQLADLDVPTVWFHTVYMGPLVILCSLAKDTADIASVETLAEHRASFENDDDYYRQPRRWTRY